MIQFLGAKFVRYSLKGTVVDQPKLGINGCSNVLPHQIPKRPYLRKRTCLLPHHMMHVGDRISLEQNEKEEVFCRQRYRFSKKVMPGLGGQLFKKRRRQGETRNKADCFT